MIDAPKKSSKFKKSPIKNRWLQNVGRSLGMTTVEMLSEIAPATIEFTQNSMETATDIYNDLRTDKPNGKKVLNSLGLSEQYNLGVQGLKNAMEDIRSGKIYNKERIESIYDDGEDFNMEDFDFDDNFNDSFDSDEPVARSSTKVINVNNNQDVVASINAQSEVIATATQATITENRQQIATGMMINRRTAELTMRGLSAINDNLSLMVGFQNNNMNNYINASIEYYDNSLRHLSETVENLKLIVNPPQQQAVGGEKAKLTNQWEDVLLSQGGLNLKGYMANVKKNFNTAVDEDLVLSSIKMFLEDKDTMKYMLASPLSFISTKVVKSLIPTILEDSIKKFDNTMANFFPAMLMKITGLQDSESANPIAELIGKVFGIQMSNKNDIDVSKYEKGQVPFDGTTRKAITEVIPTYLRKILAAVSGNSEMVYDYSSGKFSDVFSLKKRYEEDISNRAKSGYSDVITAIKNSSEAVKFTDSEDQKTFDEGINKFFEALGKSGKFFNPFKASKEDYNSLHSFGDNAGMQRLFKALLTNLDRNTLMKLNRGTLDSRSSLNRFFQELENNSNGLSVENIFNNGSKTDDIVKKDKNGVVNTVKELPKDKYNLTSLDYLRRIENILMKGIRTFPLNNGSNFSPGGSVNEQLSLPYDLMHQKDKEKLISRTSKNIPKRISSEEVQKLRDKGVSVVDNSYSLALDDSGIDDTVKEFNQRKQKEKKESQKDSSLKKIGSKMLSEQNQVTWNDTVDKFKQMITSPGRAIAGVIGKLDNVLFNLIFGTNSEEEGISFVDKMISSFNMKLTSMMNTFKEKIINPLHEKVFGEEGLVQKAKSTEIYNKMKLKVTDGGKKFVNFLLGEKDENGLRGNGLFSEVSNEIKDSFRKFTSLFTGKYVDKDGNTHYDDNNVFSTMKGVFSNISHSVKEYFSFNRKDEKGDSVKEPLGVQLKSHLIKGFTNFGNAIFGENSTSEEQVADMFASMKKTLPKTISAGLITGGALTLLGSHGFLGSLFLPGGPVGGAIVGMAGHLLTKSERFMSTVFGKKDVDGNRMGGIISKDFMSFLKKNKSIAIGGATVGLMKNALGFNGFGLLPNFLLPGGPLGGALMGASVALLTRSEKFQKLMFGAKDATGKFAGGLASGFKNFMTKTRDKIDPAMPGNILAGSISGAGLATVASNMGMLGAWFTPVGPVGGALMGAAAGIALGSKKWREAMFGKIDSESGKREGGLLGFAGNWFTHQVINPMKDTFDDVKLNIKNWFAESIAFPFREALYPIKREIGYMVERVQDLFKNGWDAISNGITKTLGKYVVEPLGKLMRDNVLTPLKKMLGIGFKTALGIFKLSASLPFKMMGFVGDRVEKRQEKRGKRNYLKEIKEMRSSGEIGLFDYMRRRFDRQAISDAKEIEKTNDKQRVIQEAKNSGMTVTDYLKSKRQQASDEYKAQKWQSNFELFNKWRKGETGANGKKVGFLDMLGGVRILDDKSKQAMMESAALGNTERYAYYKKLEKDKEEHRNEYRREAEANRIKASRRNFRDTLGKKTDYKGFVYEKDEDGEIKSKITTDRIFEILGTSSKDLDNDKKNILDKIGKSIGIKSLSSLYTGSGLDMSKMSKRQRKKFMNTILSGKFNEDMKEFSPYGIEQQEKETVSGIEVAVNDGTEKVTSRLDNVNESLKEILTTIKNGDTSSKADDISAKNIVDTSIVPSPSAITPSTSTALVPYQDNKQLVPVNTVLNKNKEEINNESQEDEKSKNISLLPAVLGDTITGLVKKNDKDKMKEKIEEANNKKKEKLENDRKHASRLTAGFVQETNDKKKFGRFLHENGIFQSTMLHKIANATASMKEGWKWAFGKKGILTGLFLFALPMILKLLGMLKNGELGGVDKDGNTITPTGLLHPFEVGTLKAAHQLGKWLSKTKLDQKIANAVKNAWDNFLNKIPTETAEHAAKGLANGADDAIRTGVKHAAPALANGLDNTGKNLLQAGSNTVGKVPNMLPGSVDNLLKEGAGRVNPQFLLEGDVLKYKSSNTKYDPSMIINDVAFSVDGGPKKNAGLSNVKQTFTDAGSKAVNETKDSALRRFMNGVKKVLMSSIDLFTNAFSKINKGAKGINNIVKEAVAKLCKYLDLQAVMKQFGKMIGSAVGLTFEMATRLLTDQFFVAYGALTGLGEAHRLFAVNKSEVDMTMRLISSAFKGLMGWKWWFLIEIANEVVEAVTDWSFFRTLAVGIYKAMSDDFDDIMLDKAMADFKARKDNYNERFGTHLTMDQYIDLQNKFMSEHLLTTGDIYNVKLQENLGRAGVKYAKSVLSRSLQDGAIDKGLIKAALEADAEKIITKIPFGDKIVNLGKHTYNFAKTAGKTIGKVAKDGAKLAVDGVKAVGKTGVNIAKKVGNKVANTTVGKTVSKVSNGIGDVVSKGATKLAGESAESAVKAGQTALIKQFRTLCSKAMERIAEAFKGKFPNIVGDLLAKLTEMMAKVTDDMLKPFIGKIASGIGRNVGAVMTAGVWNAIEFGFGAATNITKRSAADMFEVSQDSVDWIMRGITSVMEGILNVSWVFVIDILNDVWTMFGGEDFLKVIATTVYKMVASSEKAIELEAAQETLKEKTAQYNAENGKELTVSEFSSTVENVSWFTKKQQDYAAWKDKRKLNREKDKYNKKYGADLSLEEYVEWKKNRGRHMDEKVSTDDELSQMKNNSEERNKAMKAKGLDDNIYELRQIVNAVQKDGLNVATFEKLADDLNLSQEQIVGIRDVISNTMKGMSETTREKMEEITKVSGPALDGVAAMVNATLTGLDEKTLENMKPILNISEEKFNSIKNTITEVANGMDMNVATKMYESGEITREKFEEMSVIIDATTNGMSEETMKKLQPLLGITDENMSAASRMIEETMKHISGEGEYFLTSVEKENLGKAGENIQSAMKTVEEESDSWTSIIKDFFGEKWQNFKTSFKNGWNSFWDGWDNFWKTESKPNSIHRPESQYYVPPGGQGGPDENDRKFIPSKSYELSKDAKIIQSGGGGLVNIHKAKNETIDTTIKLPKHLQGGNGPGGVDEGGMGGTGGYTPTAPRTLNNFAYYAQTDPAYNNYVFDHSKGYGKSKNPTINYRGCGPTSMAMVATQLTGKTYLPTTMAKLVTNWGHSSSAGTHWGFFPQAAKHFSMTSETRSPSISHLNESLKAGKPVILSGKKRYSSSPFTTGGHFVVAVGLDGNKVIINDPRGAGYSKAYDKSNVISEAAQQWAFKYNPGGTLPASDGDYKSSNSGTTTSNTDTSGGTTTTTTTENDLGIFGKAAEAINNMNADLFGLPKTITVESLTNNESQKVANSGNSNVDAPATSQEDAIIKKALDLSAKAESGNRHWLVANDINASTGAKISPSVGLIQARGGNLNAMFRNILSKAPNNASIKKWANYNWTAEAGRGPWSQSRINELQNVLKNAGSASEQGQRGWAYNHIKNSNYGRVKDYGINTNKLTDPRSIVHLTDIANTGPALVKTFMNKFTSDNNARGDKFEYYLNQFNSKSYWGPKSIYKNRLNELKNTLRNWKPNIQGGNGEGPEEDDDTSLILANMMREIDNNNAKNDTPILSKLDDLGFGGNGGEDSIIQKEPPTPTKPDTSNEKRKENDSVKQVAESIESMTKAVEAKEPPLMSDGNNNGSYHRDCHEELIMQVIELLKGLNMTTVEQLKVMSDLSSKDLSLVTNNEIIIQRDSEGNPIIVNNVSNTSGGGNNSLFNVKQSSSYDVKYSNAKNIAKGVINN